MQQRGKMDDRVDSLHRCPNDTGIRYIADLRFNTLRPQARGRRIERKGPDPVAGFNKRRHYPRPHGARRARHQNVRRDSSTQRLL